MLKLGISTRCLEVMQGYVAANVIECKAKADNAHRPAACMCCFKRVRAGAWSGT